MSTMVKAGSKYTDEDRRRAVLEYALTGSFTKVAKSMGIPRRTINDWKQSEWWDEMDAAVRHQKNDQILAMNEEILDLAQRELVERLENGDTQLVRTKDGVKKHRVPVKAKELGVIGGIAFDKRQIALNQPTSISSKSTDMSALADEFRKVSKQWDEKQIGVVSVQLSIDSEDESVE